MVDLADEFNFKDDETSSFKESIKSPIQAQKSPVSHKEAPNTPPAQKQQKPLE